MENENNNAKNHKLKKILKITGDVFLFIIVALAMFVLVVSVSAKKDIDGTATVFGTQLRFVQSSSMEKCKETDVSAYKIKSIRVKSCVFIQTVPEDESKQNEWYSKLKVGDVLTFKYEYGHKQETITHRIVNIQKKETSGYIITLTGDNKTSESNLLSQTIDTSLADSPNYIIGKVTGQSYLLGLLVYALKTPVGIVCLIIIPCLIIIAFEVMRIIRVLSKEKTEKIKAEQEQIKAEKEKQASEIEELKRKLAILQGETSKNESESLQAEILQPESEDLQTESENS